MDFDQASRAVADVDARDHNDRATRLVELVDLLGDDVVGFGGQAAEWLFEDVKATWLYGYFTATVLTSYAFCIHQLAGLVRMSMDDPSLPESAATLEDLARICEQQRMIDLEVRARLVTLQDNAQLYLSSGLHEYGAQLERRIVETELFTQEHALLADARAALECSVAVLHRRS
jgi:hypothetical protein